jgi:hypothetical protein
VPQLVGPGVEKTNTVKVATDGTINLPMLEPLPAAGQTTAELEKQIARKYSDANLIKDPTVTVARTPATPATQTSAEPATTQPIVQSFASHPLTTQPNFDAAAAERIDVVVLLQKNPLVTNPTTEPVGAAATQPVEAK